MRTRLIWLARGAFYGFLLVFLSGIAVSSAISMVVDLTKTASFELGLGPIPLMSAWSSSTGNGFRTEWGVGALSYIGAAVGFALAWRAPRQGNATAS